MSIRAKKCSLVDPAVELTGIETLILSEAFGEFLVSRLVETCGVHVERGWTGLELTANVWTHVHDALEVTNLSEFAPPELETDREPRGLAKGVVRSVGERQRRAGRADLRREERDPHCLERGGATDPFSV